MGEQYTRCAMTLCAMTGNVGKPGGSAGGGLMVIPLAHLFRAPGIPGMRNPAEAGGKSVRGTLDINDRLLKRYHTNKVFDSILKGTAGGAPFDAKFAWFVGCNLMNQRGNTNKAARALESLEFVVVNELFLTATARYADILLPVTSAAERSDLVRPWPSGDYYPYINQALEPMYECKSDLVIATEIAERMGFENFNPHTDDEWLKLFVENTPEMAHHIKDYDKFKTDAIHIVDLPEPVVAFRAQIEDPENHPFKTPSGKIEIFSQRVADIGRPDILPPIPKYLRTPEDPFDPLAEKYPLQLLTPHAKNRVHSGLHLVPWLREVEPHRAWINPVDAEPRGIKDGDKVHIYNDRGKVAIEAWLTERIVPGVVSIFQGAWYLPDEDGVDQGGCANTLTNDEHSPGGAAVLNTSLVEVIKA
jgi:anaerobic dimethyl sulfoxide reductase subunit A